MNYLEELPSSEEMISSLHEFGWDHRHPVFAGASILKVYRLLLSTKAEHLRAGVEIDQAPSHADCTRCSHGVPLPHEPLARDHGHPVTGYAGL